MHSISTSVIPSPIPSLRRFWAKAFSEYFFLIAESSLGVSASRRCSPVFSNEERLEDGENCSTNEFFSVPAIGGLAGKPSLCLNSPLLFVSHFSSKSLAPSVTIIFFSSFFFTPKRRYWRGGKSVPLQKGKD